MAPVARRYRKGSRDGVGVRGFGELEAVVMDRVWSHDGPLTVRELFDELSRERAIAYTTVMSTMDNLHRKGWLAREKVGRAYQYWATVSRDEYTGDLMGEALAASADRVAAFRRFAERISPGEAEELRRALEQARDDGSPG